MKKRLMCLFLTLVMLIGLMPLSVFAREVEDGDDEQEPIGYVRVIVENNTCTSRESVYWTEGSTYWTGELLDETVSFYEGETAMDCVGRALAVDSYSSTGIEDGYITEINGLQADNVGYTGGWMASLNDWFTNQTIDHYTVEDGDEIRVSYTMNWGGDIGSISEDTTKTLSDLSVTGDGEMSPRFASGTKSYTLALGEGVESGTIQVVPTAYNKNFQVRTYISTGSGIGYDPTDAGYKRGADIDVSVGDTVLVVVGHANELDETTWPSMNNGSYGGAEKVEAGIYSIAVVETADTPDTDFDSFFTALDGIATVTNGAGTGSKDLPFNVTEDGTALVSTNAGMKGGSASLITMEFSKTAKLSFDYKASSEAKWDFLKISVDGKALNDGYGVKDNFSGEMTEFKSYSVEVNANQTLTLEYYKDNSGDSGSDCVWLKNFTVVLPKAVTFHANNGTGDTHEQGIFDTAALDANTFTYDGYRFAGWAETADGEVVYADGAEFTIDGDTDLYAVWTKVWNVTFPNMPEGAVITVKQGGETVEPETEGTWVLADGDYTYSAELWGYESKTDVSFTVSGADYACPDTLTEKQGHELTFSITPADAEVTITLKNSESTVMDATSNAKVYNVPDDTYSYVVESDGYKKVKGSVTMDGAARTLDITLELSSAWDGTTAEPEQADGVYQIANARHLAWLAETVNGGTTDVDAVLTADITINEELGSEDALAWTPIGANGSAYTGSFDGAGHTVSGLLIKSGSTVGLFGEIGEAGSVSNVSITVSSVTGTTNVGLLAGANAGVVSGVIVSESTVAGVESVGGVVGLNEGVVEACGNDSAAVSQSTKKDKGIGGVVGENSGSVSLCYNKAEISFNASSYGYFGGVVGNNTGSVESCYNLGTLTGGYYVGGIAGKASGSVSYCYNAGTVPSNKKALFGNGSPTASDCFFLDTCGASDTKGTAKTADELKALAPELGGSFENKDGSFPILKWENPNATYGIYITVTPAEAEVTLAKGGETVTGTFADGVYSYTGLEPGSYAWTASYETGDCAQQSGTITVGKADVYKTVELQARVYPVVFTVSPADAELTVKSGEETVEPASSENGTVTYQLKNGDYTWTAGSFGYIAQDGSFTVSKAGQNITVSLVRGTSHKLSFTNVPDGAVVTVTHATAGVQTPNADGSYDLAPATYTYTVKLQGFKTFKGEITIGESDETITVTMEALQPWDGTQADSYDGGTGTQADPYQIATGEQLYRLSMQTNLGADDASAYYVLTADIDMGGRDTYIAIGCDSSTAFTGSLDGAGYTISNISIDNDGDGYTGLFGDLKGTVKDLTVDNITVVNGGQRSGGIAGHSTNTAVITNCTVKNSSISGANYVGGIGGFCAAAVSGCVVMDTAVSGNSYSAGLAGYASGTISTSAVLRTTVSGTDNVGGFAGECKSVSESYASGVTVTGNGTSYGYAGGFVGRVSASGVKIEKCFARGTVNGTGESYGLVGGFIGGNSGYSNVTISNCYAVVDVTAASTGFGAFAGKDSSISCTNCFYSSESTVSGSGTAVDKGTAKTLAELKDSAILTSLGSAFAIKADAESNTYINSGLPYLVNTYFETVHPETLGTPTVTISGMTASWTAVENAGGYTVILTRGSTQIAKRTVTGTSADFTSEISLAGTGSYTVSVTADGDGEKFVSGAAGTASAEITVNNASVTFNVTAEGAAFAEGEPVITLRMKGGTEISLVNNTAMTVPAGEYEYTVSAVTFTTVTGTIVVGTEAIVKEITLTYSSAWDGVTTVEPTYDAETRTYTITNGYELAWFRDKVNADVEAASTAYNSPAYNAVLANDIDLGGHDWIAISKIVDTSAKKGYIGTFDGAGHGITGLKSIGSEVTSYGRTNIYGASLFGYLYTGGVIKNLEVSGSFEVVQYSAGVCAILGGGRIENCVSHVTLTQPDPAPSPAQFVGGITGSVGYSATTSAVVGCGFDGTINLPGFSSIGGIVGGASAGTGIENCWNSGSITGSGTVGGVCGNAAMPITASYNTGAVTGTSGRVGGIAGFANKAVTDCYNTGSVTGNASSDGVGGIVGQVHNAYGGSIAGSYNTGLVTATTGDSYGAIAGAKGTSDETKGLISRSYYLTGTSTKAIGANANDKDEAAPVSGAELSAKRIVGLLGGAFAKLEGTAYPVLKWQDENAKNVVYFDVTPESAQVALTKDGTAVTTDEANAYTIDDSGEYAYTVSMTGYNSASGSVTIGSSSVVTVALERETFDVTFTVTPEDAVVTVYDADKNVAGTGTSLKLPNGDYTYTVTKFGYAPASGSFKVEDAAVEIPAITLTGEQTYAVTLSITYDGETPADTAITVRSGDETVGTASSLTLPSGDYTYTVTASGYFTAEGSFKVEDAATTVDIAMQTRTTWDGETATPAAQVEDGYYLIDSAEKLAWFQQQVNAGTGADYDARLTANIYINDELTSNEWTSIGTYNGNYTGTFDGNGKAIRGLDSALFAFIGEGGTVKDTAVYGSVTGVSNVGAIAMQTYGAISGCTNYAAVTGTNLRVGGIVGIVYATGSVTNCANYGTVSSTYTGDSTGGYGLSSLVCVGGIAGQTAGAVTGCYNAGDVSAPKENYGGVGGIVGAFATTGTGTASVMNSYNVGSVTGTHRFGGIVGSGANGATANCYNAGTITCTGTSYNPFGGAVIGALGITDVADGTVNNCYYLENSFTYNYNGEIRTGGVGYGTDTTESRAMAAMKLDSFVIALGESFNFDSENINSGYPVLDWQGGREPQVSEDEAAVAADKAALEVTPTTVRKAMTLTLPTSGENGTTITWSSSNTAVISSTGVVTLPTANNTTVTLTATISKNGISDTKTFDILVMTKAEADKAELDAIAAGLNTVFSPVYGTDVNINDYTKARIAAKITDDTGFTAEDVTVALVSAGTRTYPASDTAVHFAADGTISYFYEDPSTLAIALDCAIVRDVKLRITTASGASAEITVQVNLPWDAARVREAMRTQIADNLTFDLIKGANTGDAASVTENLVLPAKLSTAGWATISWTSANDAITVQPGNLPSIDDGTGVVTRLSSDSTGSLTATITFNRDSSISITKDIAITVPAAESEDHMAVINDALSKYTLDKLTYSDLEETFDPTNVKGDIQLLRARDLGIDGGSSGYGIAVTASSGNVTVNGYRANVLRPLPGGEPVTVTLTVTITYKPNTAISNSKVIGTITLAPIEQSVIDAEIALMEEVKAHYFDGIKGENTSADAITANMHNFQEVYRGADGQLVWVTNYADRTGSGIVPSDFPEYDSMSGLGYRLFKSSNEAVITHENLLVTRPVSDTKITISSYLSSQTFARYAELYPDNADMQKLSMQFVSVEVTVLAKDKTPEESDKAAAKAVEDAIAAIGTVTLDKEQQIVDARNAWKGLTEAQRELVSNTDVLDAAEAELARLKQEQAELEKDKAAAKAVEDEIAAIGDVTLDSEQAIKSARNNYNKLTDAQKKLVGNEDVLAAAEAKLNELKNASGYLSQMNSVLEYIMANVGSPKHAYMSGEWAVLAEARANVSAASWYSSYVDNLAATLKSGGTLEKPTDYARAVLALTSVGLDASGFEANGTTYDLTAALKAKTGSTYNAAVPGTTSAAFALIALDSKPYASADTDTRDGLITYLLSRQKAEYNGAWDINDENTGANLDATAMALTALVPYKDRADVAAAIEKGIAYLANAQSSINGGYGSPEADAQVITALSALGIDCRTDSRFVKSGNNPVTSMLRYQLASGGFKHELSDSSENQMSTEQAAYALVAYWRFDTSRNRLYDMSDAQSMLPDASDAQAVIDMIDALGTVKNCRRSTYLDLKAIESAYSKLSPEQQKLVTNYDEYQAQLSRFNTLLKSYIDDKIDKLGDYYLSLDEDRFTKDQWRKITAAYRDGQKNIRAAEYAEEADAAYNEAIDLIDKYVSSNTIEVSFRLIGDFVHGGTGHDTYVTWIETTEYELPADSTVYDLFIEAISDAGLSQRGASGGYVSEIKAPSVLGGYWLGEFDNGSGSGWMYTVNGKHPDVGLGDYDLGEGDSVIWHYVDNYKTEQNAKTWLEADDISPEAFARRAVENILTVGRNGSASPDLKFSDLGKTVTFTFTPDKGYRVADVVVDGESVGAVESYTYKNLSVSSRIVVTFEKVEDIWFKDVTEKDWFYDDVMYVVKAGLFNGTDDHVFTPNGDMTRAMLVTVLYRLEGEPKAAATGSFTDVASGKWYTSAVNWASANGIVNGVGNGRFDVDGSVTREQMAAILYRYAQYKGYSVAKTADISAFADSSSISAYAVSAMSWANGSGLINGVGANRLEAQGSATRAQVAAILHRFVENVAAK